MKEFDKKNPKDTGLNKDKTINTPQSGRPADVNRINQGGHQTGGGAGRADLGHLNKDKDKTDKR